MEYTSNNNNSKIIMFVVFCILIMIAMIGYTYSYLNIKNTNNSEIAGSVTSLNLTININKISPSSSDRLVPQLDEFITSAVIGRNGSCVDDNNNNVCQVYEIKVKNISNMPLNVHGKVLLNAGNNPNLKWARITGVSEPTLISSVNSLSTKRLVQNELFNADEEKIYYIVVWISETNYAQTDTGIFTGSVTFEDANYLSDDVDNSGANVPELVNGLIPVYYNADSNKWITTDETNENTIWYNYSKKKWANAILVDSSIREQYKVPETQVDMTKVLAFYVWVPRYKYKVWNINKTAGTATYDAYTEGIDISFEIGKETTGTITCSEYNFKIKEGNGLSETCHDITGGNGYYTHPAFAFGENNDLTGFWVAKFEPSNTTSLIKVLPNEKTLAKITVSAFWNAIYNMQKTNNSYGLPTDRLVADSHMMTNMEWGAVAYLTHSEYGRCTGGENSTCTEVAKNNSLGYYTGKSSGEPAGGSEPNTDQGTYTYETPQGQLASTTGNIYGVYDMSGGATEYVMGSLGDSSTAGTSYKYYANAAGTSYSYTGYEKYLTTYSYGVDSSTQNAYNRGRLGDATSEVITSNLLAWYDDFSYFPYSSYNWFTRGGFSNLGSNTGIFLFAYNTGVQVASYTVRPVLMKF